MRHDEPNYIQKGKTMRSIDVKVSGDFKGIEGFFSKIKRSYVFNHLEKYGEMGVRALRDATPVDTGETRDSWGYEITQKSNGDITISWTNSRRAGNTTIPVVMLLEYGHATRSGSYVEGLDFINPALKPVFDKMAADAWEEVTNA